MTDRVESQINGLIGPDQEDRERFSRDQAEDSFLDKFSRVISKPWVRGTAAAGASGVAFIAPEVVLAQQVDQSQVAQKPQVYADVDPIVNPDLSRIIHPQPLSDSDQAVKNNLLSQIGNRSGILFTGDKFNIEYSQTANQVMVNLGDNLIQDKQDAQQWFIDQGFSQQGICNLPVVFNASNPSARRKLIDSGVPFSLTPDGCLSEQPNPQTPVAGTATIGNIPGNTPDTDPVYQRAAEEGTKKMEATVDPFQMQAQLILELPYQGQNFSLNYDYKTNTFTESLSKDNQSAGSAEFIQFLHDHNVDLKSLKHLNKEFN